MIIYFEGVDGSGKSTLLDLIANNLEMKGYIIDKYGNRNIPTHPKAVGRVNEKDLFNALKIMAKSKVVYLVDRGPISDFIYRVFDDYKCVTSINKFISFLKVHNREIFTIYCDSDKSYDNMITRGEDNPTALNKHKELRKVYNMFMNFLFNELEYNKIKVDPMDRSKYDTLETNINYFCYMNNK